MKAKEFIKNHGWKYTIDLLKSHPNHTHTTDDGRMFFNINTCADEIKVQLIELAKFCDLKIYVDAYELVQSYGGLVESKRAVELKSGLVNLEGWDSIERAIALVEEVENYDEKTKEGDPS